MAAPSVLAPAPPWGSQPPPQQSAAWQQGPGSWCPGGHDWPCIRPVYPCPRTLQYRDQCGRPLPHLELPSPAVSCDGWVVTNLEHITDASTKSLADKYLVGPAGIGGTGAKFYYLRIDGWMLQYWDKDTDNAAARLGLVQPVGLMDLRRVVHVEVNDVRGGWHEVVIGMRSGSYTFRVRDHMEALTWKNTIRQAIVEYAQLQRARLEMGRERARDSQSRVLSSAAPVWGSCGQAMERGSDGFMHFSISPVRAATLRKLWVDCLKTAYEKVPTRVFREIFALYDLDGDAFLDQDEIEIMLRELYSVRHQELCKALEGQRKQIFTPERIILNLDQELEHWWKDVGSPGEELRAHYGAILQRGGVEARAVILRSELDISRDGQVSLSEFLRGATQFLLPRKELLLEVDFYKQCAKALERNKWKEDEYEEEPGCIHQ